MPVTVDDVRLPASIERRAQGVREYRTKIFEAENGFEPARRAVWANARRKWVIQSIPVSYAALEAGTADVDLDDIRQVISMFEAAKGMAYAFKYRPNFDHTALTGEGIITDGVYYKRYSNGVRHVDRAVLPATGLYTTGGGGWEGIFDVPVRFDMDEFEDELAGDDNNLVLPTIRLREILLT